MKSFEYAAPATLRDALSLLDQAIVQKGDPAGDKKKKKAEAVTASDIREMLGLADRARVIDLFTAIANGDAKTALTEIREQYDRGADPARARAPPPCCGGSPPPRRDARSATRRRRPRRRAEPAR